MKYIKQTLRSASASGGSVSADNLYGIDAHTQVRESSISRAAGTSTFLGKAMPGCLNMIRKSEGTVTKRPAYSVISHPDTLSSIGGVHVYKASDREIIFYVSGSKIVRVDGSNIYEYNINFVVDNCQSLQFNEYMLFYSKNGIVLCSAFDSEIVYWSQNGDGGTGNNAYIPTVFIGNTPSAVGIAYENINLLNAYVYETYQGDGSSKQYWAHYRLDDAYAYVKDASGNWTQVGIQSKDSNSVVLSAAPQKPQVSGEDNVRIMYRLKDYKSSDALIGCTCGTTFGVGGHRDRVFLSGNRFNPGKIYYSALDNPLYFPELNYIKVGDSQTNIYGLLNQDGSLAVLTSDNVYTVNSAASQSAAYIHDAVFAITDVYATSTPVGPQAPIIFDNEPVYLTDKGICSLSASGIVDERCAQIRSTRINLHLLNEKLNECKVHAYGDWLVISNCKDTLYLLDGKQFSQTSSQPFSSRQYEGYVWINICAKCIWTQSGKLCFSDGVYAFCFNNETIYSDEMYPGVYRDIEAYWETPHIYCADFKDNKYFTSVGVLVDGTVSNGDEGSCDFEMFARFDNDNWRQVKNYSGFLHRFEYLAFDYRCFTYRTKIKNYSVLTRLKHKKARAIKLRFQNAKKHQPFTMLRFGIDYIKT